MGMFDTIIFHCAKCNKIMTTQTKILGNCSLHQFVVGNTLKHKENEDPLHYSNTIFNEHFDNCIFKVKEKCRRCGKINYIKIEDSVLKEVIKDKNEAILVELGNLDVVEEGRFGSYVIKSN
jgi:hypothetical protein